MSLIRKFLADASGASSVEYAIIAGAIALVIAGIVSSTGQNASRKLQAVSNNLT